MESTPSSDASTRADQIEDKLIELMSSGVSLGEVFDYSPEECDAVYALGYNLYNQARYLDATKAFSFLVMHNQFERRYYNALASSLQMQQQYRDAIQFYSMASIMDLSDPMPTFRTAECMLPLGLYAEAEQALKLVIEQSQQPEHVELLERATTLLSLINKHNLSDEKTLLVVPERAVELKTARVDASKEPK